MILTARILIGSLRSWSRHPVVGRQSEKAERPTAARENRLSPLWRAAFGPRCLPHRPGSRSDRTLCYAPKNMDLTKVLAELHEERDRIDEAILMFSRLAAGAPKRRGRPPKWMAEITPKRRGRPPKSAVAAAVSETKPRRGRKGMSAQPHERPNPNG